MAMMASLPLRCVMSTIPENAGGSTSTVDNKVCGVIYDVSGNPAGNAKVVVRSSDYILHGGQLGKRNAEGSNFVRSTRTDSLGKFRFTALDSIPAGEYFIGMFVSATWVLSLLR